MLKVSEGDIKRAVSDYLQYAQNQGLLYFSRLNSGIAYVKRGNRYYAIQLCEAGTADFFVLKAGRVIFLEIKSAKGKLRTEQKCFRTLVASQLAEYYVIRDVSELAEILK